MAYLLGVDIGTGGARALLTREDGTPVASATSDYPLYQPYPQWAEQEPEDWWQGTVKAVRQVLAESGVLPESIRALGLSGQMHGVVLLDGADRVLRRSIIWADQRSQAQCDWITERIGAQRLVERTSNPALTGFSAPKLLWIRDHEPAVFERARRFLLPKDYVRFRLTGEYATEVSDASGTSLFDVQGRDWAWDVVDDLGLDRGLLPPAFESPVVSGRVAGSAAAETGLPEGLPVVGGGGDQAAGAVGNGIVETGIVSSTIGTSGVVFAFTDVPRRDDQGRLQTFCHAVPGKWHVMGLCDAERSVGALTGRDPYEYITQAAAQVGPGAEGLLFLPYLTGERTPHRDPYAKGAFIGLSLRHTRAHMARAVLEGVAFGMADGLAVIREMGVPVQEVRASGGGARSALWRQIQADVYQLPLSTINVDEGPAYGAALLAAVGAGLYGSVPEACDATIRVVDQCDPDPAASRAYAEWAEEYRAAYRALAPGFRRCAEMLAE